jgi:hypothetical protein
VGATRGGRGAARGDGGLSSRRLAWLQATHRRGQAVGLWLCVAAAVARTGAALVPLGALATVGPLRVLTPGTEPAPAAVFAALGLTAGLANETALRVGLDVCLAAGAAGGVVLALAAQKLHFRSAAGHRRHEYGGLLAHGMSPDLVWRSLAVERVIVAGTSLLAGGALGGALALALLSA